MHIEYKELVPEWALENDKHDLVLSNDIDSLASCAVLKKVKGWDVKYFYDFENVYKIKDYEGNNEKCWVDVAIKEGHAFDNHVSKIGYADDWNEEMVNLNQMEWIACPSYENKYAGSTLLEIWSLYDLPLPKTEEGKMLLLAIDVTFKGFYSDKFKDIQKRYLVDILGFDELYEVIKRHKEKDFYKYIEVFGLNEDIICKDGKLSSSKLKLKQIGILLGLDLSLPTDTYEVEEELELIKEDMPEYYSSLSDVSLFVFTLALPFKNKIIYSKIKNEEKQNQIRYDMFKEMIRRRGQNVRVS
jgi:hypothetical protein